jgi:F-type H+-transporting ATPase subunit b
VKRQPYLHAVFGALVLGLILVAGEAWAEGGASTGRKIWDNVMLFVNFGILVFLFIKYAKKPLMDFLHGVRRKHEENLGAINDRFESARSALNAQDEKLREMEQSVETIQKGIIEMGKREKEVIIEQAKKASERMISDAKAYADYRLAMARKALADEMVDTAIEMVREKLTGVLSESDNQRLIDHFLGDLPTAKTRIG